MANDDAFLQVDIALRVRRQSGFFSTQTIS